MNSKPIPIPRGGFTSNEDEARWLADTIAMRARETLMAATGISSNWPTDSLYELLWEGLDAAARRARKEAERWLPITEYPRDKEGWGPNVLLFVPTGLQAPASDYRILTGRLEAEMWLNWDDGGGMGEFKGQPSHWMPLPTAPSVPQRRAADNPGERSNTDTTTNKAFADGRDA